MGFRKMVHTPRGKLVELKIGYDKKILLDQIFTGYKLGQDGIICTENGSVVSNNSVEDFLRSQGNIK